MSAGDRGLIVVRGRMAFPGAAEGPALVSRQRLGGWDTFDLTTGNVREIGHVLEGQSLRGRVLILGGSRGSTGWATQFLRLRVAGMAPVAMVFPAVDARMGAACVVTKVPVVTDVDQDIFELVQSGDWVRVDANRGLVEITPKAT